MVQCSALTEEEASSRPWSAIWIKHDTAARRHCWQAEAKSPLFHFILLFFIPSSLGLFSTAFTVVAVKTQVFRSRHPGNITYDMSTHTHTHIPFFSDGYFSTLLLLLCALCSIPFIPLERRLKLKRNVLQGKLSSEPKYFGPLAATIIRILFFPFFFSRKKNSRVSSFVGCCLVV